MSNCKRALFVSMGFLALAAAAEAAPPKVLVLASSASSGPDVQAKLMKTNAFAAVDLLTVYDNTPTVAQLKPYDAVAVYSYLSFKDAKTLGDNLATYLEGGGGVVLFDYETEEIGTYQLDGRFQSTYTLMTPQKGTDLSSAQSTLGKVLEPGSALLAGVNTFGCPKNGTCHHLSSAPKNGGVVVAQWADATPLVIRGGINGHTLVELNFLPASTGTGIGEWDQATDGAILMKNALLYVLSGAVRGDLGALNFPDTPIGNNSPAQTVTYTNTGMKDAVLTNLAFSGANPGDFLLTPQSPLPHTLPAGGQFTVAVTFSPAAKGARKAVLQGTVVGQMNTVDTALFGNGTGGAIAVVPTPVQLGGTKLGAPVSKMIKLSNTTNGNVTIQSLTVTTDAAEFAVVPSIMPPVTLAAGSGIDANITFTPAGAGSKMGAITMKLANLPDQNINLLASAGDGMLALNNNAVVLGSQHVNVAAPPSQLSATNVGFNNLTVIGAAVSGANGGDFILAVPKLPAVLAPGQSLPYSLVFKPSALGARSAAVTFTSDDPKNPMAAFAVSGTGVSFSETINPVTLDFGNVKAGTTSMALTTTLSNLSAAPLGVLSVAVAGKGAADFQAQAPMAPFSIPANGTLPVSVVYAPMAAGVGSSTLTIGLDDPKTPTVTVALKGTGTAGKLTFKPAMINFGGVAVSSSSLPVTVTLTNAGQTDLGINDVSIGGQSLDAFQINNSPATPLSLPAGGKLSFDVVYSPTMAMADTAEIDISSDDPSAAMAKIPLSGMGTQAGLSVTPMALDFGMIPLSVSSAAMVVQVMNTGNANLAIDGATITGGDAASFSADGMGPAMVKPGATQMIHVTYSPMMVGMASATLTITPTDMSLMPVDVPLTGIGVSSALGITPPTMNFGITNVGTTSPPTTFTIKNAAAVALPIAAVTSNNPDFVVDASAVAMPLPPGATTTFTVAYAPMKGGPSTGSVAITLQGAHKASGVVTVTGEGLVVMPPAKPKGGCAVGGGGEGRPLALLIGIGLVALALRRRRTSERICRSAS